MICKMRDLVPAIVEAMLPIGTGTPDKMVGLLLKFNCEAHSNSGREVSTSITMLILRLSNYTRVLVNEGFGSIFPGLKILMNQHSYHDSCWRSDGMMVFSKVQEELRKELKRQGANHSDIIFDCMFDTSLLPQYVEVSEIKKVNPSDDSCRDFSVVLGKRISVKEIGEYFPVKIR